MRPFLYFVVVFLLFSLPADAQNSGDCRTVIPVCADGIISGVADGSGNIDDFDPDVISVTGCLEKGSGSSQNIENNTSWFVFRAGTGGQVGFDIESLPVGGGTGTITAEWDFAVYGPDVNCGDISSGLAQPIRCNYEVNGTDFTGIGVNPINGQVGASFLAGSQNTYDEWLEVLPGEIYYILINNYNTNFDGDSESYSLTFTGSSVDNNPNTALDCTLRDEFLGLDINACEGDPSVTLSALNSPVGSDIASVQWTVDYEDDGVVDANLTGTGTFGAELVVSSPDTGRYFAEITTASMTPPTVADDGGILITFHGDPVINRIERLETNLSIDPDKNNVEIFVTGNSSYEYAVNGGAFQDSPILTDLPPGINNVVVNDKNGCGINDLDFLVIGYPKFFTPNEDGRNDTWNIEGLSTLLNPRIYIYDRYGKLLVQLINGNEWDGMYNSVPMPSSDYWFKFEYDQVEDASPVAKFRKTHFTLKR